MKIALALGLVLIACALSSCTLSQSLAGVENNSSAPKSDEGALSTPSF